MPKFPVCTISVHIYTDSHKTKWVKFKLKKFSRKTNKQKRNKIHSTNTRLMKKEKTYNLTGFANSHWAGFQLLK